LGPDGDIFEAELLHLPPHQIMECISHIAWRRSSSNSSSSSRVKSSNDTLRPPLVLSLGNAIFSHPTRYLLTCPYYYNCYYYYYYYYYYSYYFYYYYHYYYYYDYD